MLQDVTYWSPTGSNVYGGSTYSAPLAFKGRWENKVEQFRDKSGQESSSRAKVFIPETVAVDIDGYLFEGVSAAIDPLSVDGAYEIRMKAQIPDLRNLTSLTTVYL